MEITPIGILSLVSLLAGLLMGGQLQFQGLTLSLDTRLEAFYVTPIVAVALPVTNYAGAVTLGGTTLYYGYPEDLWPDPSIAPAENSKLLAYERTHVGRWNHFGLLYPLYIASDPCAYDPALERGRCPNSWPTAPPLPPRTGAFRWSWR